MDKVTMIIPAYNAEKTIEKCLDSVLNQTYSNLEILIIDDGSSDRTAEIVNKYSKQDSRINLYQQQNAGVSSARNQGLNLCTGKYIQFIDADDYLEKDMTEKLVGVFEKDNEVGLVSCICVEDYRTEQKMMKMTAREEMNKVETMRAMLEPDSIRGFLPNKLFVAEIIRKNAIRMEEDIYVCEDLVFCLQYASYVKKSNFINKVLYHYVYRDDSVTHKKYNEKKFSVIKAFETIQTVTKPYGDKKLNHNVETHYLVLIIQLFVMLKRNHYSMSSEEMKIIMNNMRERNPNLIGTRWNFRYKVTALPIKLLSMIYGKKEEWI